MTAACFTFELSLLTDCGTAPASLAQLVNRMRTAQMQSVFAEFSSQFISNRIKLSYLFRLQRIIKKRILNEAILLQIKQNNSGGAVNIFRAVAVIKKIVNDTGKFQREGARTRKLCLTA
jgi:hypothetical protein